MSTQPMPSAKIALSCAAYEGALGEANERKEALKTELAAERSA